MRGTDCTPEQVAHAKQFIECSAHRSLDGAVTLDINVLARLVAWYGAVRFIAGRDGEGGTLERPGPIGGFTELPWERSR